MIDYWCEYVNIHESQWSDELFLYILKDLKLLSFLNYMKRKKNH